MININSYTQLRLPNAPFVSVLLPGIMLCTVPHLWMTPVDLFHFLNPGHTTVTDMFFMWITYFGNTYVLTGILLIVLIFNKRNRGFLLRSFFITLLLCTVIVILSKHFIWPEAPRPIGMPGIGSLELVDGIRTHARNSFPSGHTATAVALFYVLSFFGGRNVKVLLGGLVLLVGYSRIYLNQHFAIDVSAGGIIGLATGVAGVYFGYSMPFRFKPQPYSYERRSMESQLSDL